LLNQEKVQEVLSLLKKGFSQYKISAFSGISKPTVSKIAAGKHRLSHTLTRVSKPVRSDDSLFIPLDLRGEEYERYKSVRRRVRQQVDAGLRKADSALSGDFVPKT
jgi:transcriptional regulator with XRE-family HTH domain